MNIRSVNDDALELRHVRLLLAVGRTGSLSRAAQSLNLSQPAASHQMKTLEEWAGGPLFERKTRPLRFTPAGERILEFAFELERSLQDTARDLEQLSRGEQGMLRIAVECHSCFDWLMPAMDIFRERWPGVNMDLVSGFHADPIGLLHNNLAELVIVSQSPRRRQTIYEPLFRYEVFALLGKQHPLGGKPFLEARDFARETLISYPIPDERIDVIRDVLAPAGIRPARRVTELTVAILQLVASHRGVAALPGWNIQEYVDREYVLARPIRRNGLVSNLYAAIHSERAATPYLQEFIQITREICLESFPHVMPG